MFVIEQTAAGRVNSAFLDIDMVCKNMQYEAFLERET